MPVAAMINGVPYAVHADHLLTPRMLTGGAGQAVWQWEYSAFGDEPATVPTRAAGNDVVFNLRYPGQYFDAESELHYNYFRSYDARTGNYLQSDPIGLAGGWNRYAYVKRNPMSYSDPLGLGPWDKLYGLPKEFWKWLHREEGGDLMKAYKDPKTGQVPKEDAKELYERWKKSKEGGFVDPSMLEGFLPWGSTPSPLMCGTLDCHPERFIPKQTCS
jgi:RHS repeat-associated protein